jgi:hypothetical protein
MLCGFLHSGRNEGDDAEARQRSFVRHAQKVGSIIAICLTVWLLSGAGTFWPGWVILVLGIRLGAHARWAYRSEPDRIEA